MNKNFEDPVGKPFEMPNALLNSLSECSPEGFIIFYIDNMGVPQVRASFNHQITEMGLRSYATKFLQGINSVEESGITENLHQEDDGAEENFEEES